MVCSPVRGAYDCSVKVILDITSDAAWRSAFFLPTFTVNADIFESGCSIPSYTFSEQDALEMYFLLLLIGFEKDQICVTYEGQIKT